LTRLAAKTLFDRGNLAQPYHSINTDVHKRIRHLETHGDVTAVKAKSLSSLIRI